MKTAKTIILTLILSMISTNVMPKTFTKAEIFKYNTTTIFEMIKVVQPKMNDKKRKKIALALYRASKKYAIDPKIMVAIISTESDFNHAAVSITGDLSLAQINTKVWNAEFLRLGLSQINIKLLKKDEAYALNKMGKILSILKNRHEKKDTQWYANYHSKTKKFKNVYNIKVQSKLKLIATVANTTF